MLISSGGRSTGGIEAKIPTAVSVLAACSANAEKKNPSPPSCKGATGKSSGLYTGPLSNHEADLPTKEAQASQDARVSCPDADAERSLDHQAPAPTGPEAPDTLKMARGGARSRGRGRLSRSGDFDRVYREGSSRANRHFVLYEFNRGEDEPGERRLGVSVGKRVGSAVVRNRVKRVMREAFWQLSDRLPESRDFVLVARADAAELVESEGLDGVVLRIEDILPKDAKPAEDGERST